MRILNYLQWCVMVGFLGHIELLVIVSDGSLGYIELLAMVCDGSLG